MEERRTVLIEPRAAGEGPSLQWAGKRPLTALPWCPAALREVYGEAREGWRNKLFWGENLSVMGHLLEEFRGKVDLVYIDPPFASRSDYKKPIGPRGSAAAFAEKQYGDIWTDDGYLQFMYERLLALRELLSDRGSIYLHCDWHKAAHLRLLMDEVFGPERFLNEIAWCYQGTGKTLTQYKRKHDTLLFYAKGGRWTFNARAVGTPFGEEQKKKYSGQDEKGRYKEYRHPDGRVYRKYLREDDFLPRNDWWSDISVIQDHGERAGYPTQKPEALLRRIIAASSNPGDLVLDCFMGSGTAQAAALKLGRRFIGVDANPGAVQTATRRLLTAAPEGDRCPGLEVWHLCLPSAGAHDRPAPPEGEEALPPETSRADIALEGGELVIRSFRPAELLRRLPPGRTEDWRRLVDSVMIDWHYDGAVLRPAVTDVPGRKELVRGVYAVPADAGVIRVKLTDLLAHSLEVELRPPAELSGD